MTKEEVLRRIERGENGFLLYQNLNTEVILALRDRWTSGRLQLLARYQNLSTEVIEELKLDIPKTHMYYWPSKRVADRIRQFGYEIIDDEVIAYKTTKLDGASVYDDRYKYEMGGTYTDWHCDCNISHKNSYGFGAWAKEEALDYYCEGKLFKIKIPLTKVGCVADGGKIRCWEFTVVEEVDK